MKFDLAAALTAGARVHLAGPLWLEGRLHGSLRTRSDSLVLEDPSSGARTTLFVVTPWDLGLSLGLHARY